MKFVCDIDGKEFPFKPTPLSRAVAEFTAALHSRNLLESLGLPPGVPLAVAKAEYNKSHPSR